MIHVVVGDAPALAPEAAHGAAPEAMIGDSLVVRVAPYPGPADRGAAREAKVSVAVADPALARVLTTAVAEVIRAVVSPSTRSDDAR